MGGRGVRARDRTPVPDGRPAVTDELLSRIRILGAAGNDAFALESEPGEPPGGWRIGVYAWRWAG